MRENFYTPILAIGVFWVVLLSSFIWFLYRGFSDLVVAFKG